MRRLRRDFPGSERASPNFAQAGQDLWVLQVLGGKEGGTYLEVGCNVPSFNNNTYLLEGAFGWRGVSLDILPGVVGEFNRARRNRAVLADACSADYAALLAGVAAEGPVDYASVDCEPPEFTLAALRRLTSCGRRFRCITFEHDAYYAGGAVRAASREYLAGLGYEAVATDVSAEGEGKPFEDWWVDPLLVDAGVAASLRSTGPRAWEDCVFLPAA